MVFMNNNFGEGLHKLGEWTGGILPSDAAAGGLLAQIPVLLGGDDIKAGAFQLRSKLESNFPLRKVVEWAEALDKQQLLLLLNEI